VVPLFLERLAGSRRLSTLVGPCLEALGRGDEAKGVLFNGWKAGFDAVVVVVALKVSLVGEKAAPSATATRGCRLAVREEGSRGPEFSFKDRGKVKS
jgi:hypothetical protein